MAAGQKLTPEIWEQIVINNAYGMSNKDSAEELHIGESTVRVTLMCFNVIKNRDWNRIIEIINNGNYNCPIQLLEWATARTKTSLPANVRAAYDAKINRDREQRLSELKQKEAKKVAQKEDASKSAENRGDANTAQAMLLILQALNEQNELLEQLMDVVIPKYVGDTKDNLNANCDVVNRTLLDIKKELEAIKLAARRRGA